MGVDRLRRVANGGRRVGFGGQGGEQAFEPRRHGGGQLVPVAERGERFP